MTSSAAQLPLSPRATSIVYTVTGVLPVFLVSAQVLQIQQDIVFSRTTFGLAVSGHFAISACASLTLGSFVDRLGGRFGIRFTAAVAGAVLLWLGVATRAAEITGLLLVAGLTASVGHLSANRILASQVTAGRRAFAFGLKQSAVPLASMIAGSAVPVVALTVGWRTTMVFFAVVCLLLSAFAPGLVSGQPATTPAGEGGRAVEPTTSTRLGLWLLVMAGFFAGLIGNQLPVFAVDAAVVAGSSEAMGGTLLGVASAIAIGSRIWAGALIDRRAGTGYGMLLVLMTGAAVSFAALALLGDVPTRFAPLLVVAFATAWSWQGVMYFIVVRTQNLPPAMATGRVVFGVFAGTAAGPSLVGVLAGLGGYELVWWVGAATLLIASVGVAGSRAAFHRREARAGGARRPL